MLLSSKIHSSFYFPKKQSKYSIILFTYFQLLKYIACCIRQLYRKAVQILNVSRIQSDNMNSLISQVHKMQSQPNVLFDMHILLYLLRNTSSSVMLPCSKKYERFYIKISQEHCFFKSFTLCKQNKTTNIFHFNLVITSILIVLLKPKNHT